ncbi:hypothetical protein LOTGIDRAFT_153909 [Lottia gigantea]|uniref:Uncharacterized protein n=1 Tax=Lottia gigantea TaxID=225164 RepID=V4A8U6_LOTGI|nr:hypothetical protein LOTGIDRAFT_153909 [Lottia gigantea]ESO91465.1 hypothetical protein LOTGIDRAFT_153909 [Lottia gigantea]
MKPETLVMKIIEAMETNSPTLITYNAAADATAGGAAGIAKAVNDKKAEAAANAEARRNNLAMEREARGGSGVGDILGTVKEFGQRFGEETKKTVKEGLSKLIDKIDTKEMKSINHGMDRDTFKKVCKAQWRNPDDHGYVFVNTRKPAGERVMIDIC